jgi:hypothetical protein
MAQTTLEDLEKRVADLEKRMAELTSPPPISGWKDWRQAVGKFVRTELSEEVDAAGREIREADRRQAEP